MNHKIMSTHFGTAILSSGKYYQGSLTGRGIFLSTEPSPYFDQLKLVHL